MAKEKRKQTYEVEVNGRKIQVIPPERRVKDINEVFMSLTGLDTLD